jgi:hypothetical protein
LGIIYKLLEGSRGDGKEVVRKKDKKKFKKKFEKKFEKKVRGGGFEGGELSFQCLRPSTSLMAAGKNK